MNRFWALRWLPAAAGGLAVAAGAPGSLAQAAPSGLSAERITEDVKVLSSDAFEGRGIATPAEKRTLDYLIGRFTAAGVKPGAGGGGWTQAVPLVRFEPTGDIRLSFSQGGEARPLALGEQIAVTTQQPVDHVSIKDAPLVFVGYGVTAPERHWDDFKGVDVKGKVLVVLVNDPDYWSGVGDFDGKAMTWYGRWPYKFEEAARQGAVGALIVHETGPAGYGWATVRNSTNVSFDIERADPARTHPLMQGWIQRDVAVDLFRRSGLDFDALAKLAQTRDFKPVALTGQAFSADFAVKTSRIVTHNVIGVLPGKSRPDETVVYSAHWDHLGIGPPDATGDRIYHGAADDAVGVAAVLELARSFAKGPKLGRSVVFIGFAAEESGLLGGEYYAAHPVYPLAKTAAVFNMDVLAAAGPVKDMILVGYGKTTIEDELKAVAARHGLTVRPDAQPEIGSFYRGDQFPLAKAGVPVLPLMELAGGHDLVKGGRAAGDAWVRDYTAKRYHQPADIWSPDWDLRGVIQELTVLRETGAAVAGGREWPQWKPGAEFKAARDASAAERKE